MRLSTSIVERERVLDLEFLTAHTPAAAILLGFCARPAADAVIFISVMVSVEKSQRVEAIKAIRSGQPPMAPSSSPGDPTPPTVEQPAR
ncbi:hypothetical protein GCM10009828_060860 [Actinoplanes couchii]|uniref:Uncharacterized protein n=1 Tax=Actinoplanes couchii TaxID=403638 RepID=A0ABQ3XQ26_9ACTN|nr:hypothetical protein Aco03nite_090360 [Actinoplanes couchii]